MPLYHHLASKISARIMLSVPSPGIADKYYNSNSVLCYGAMRKFHGDSVVSPGWRAYMLSWLMS